MISITEKNNKIHIIQDRKYNKNRYKRKLL